MVIEAKVVSALSNILNRVGPHDWRKFGGASSSASLGSGKGLFPPPGPPPPGPAFPLRHRREARRSNGEVRRYALVPCWGKSRWDPVLSMSLGGGDMTGSQGWPTGFMAYVASAAQSIFASCVRFLPTQATSCVDGSGSKSKAGPLSK